MRSESVTGNELKAFEALIAQPSYNFHNFRNNCIHDFINSTKFLKPFPSQSEYLDGLNIHRVATVARIPVLWIS